MSTGGSNIAGEYHNAWNKHSELNTIESNAMKQVETVKIIIIVGMTGSKGIAGKKISGNPINLLLCRGRRLEI